MEPIKDYSTYLSRMSIGMYDKCWWIDKIDPQVKYIFDFGCANGSLFKMINAIAPGRFKYIGIDSSKEMSKEFHKQGYSSEEAIFRLWDGFLYFNVITPASRHFCNDPEGIKGEESILIMNSVCHELYTYGDKYCMSKIIDRFYEFGVHHVAVRDMFYHDEFAIWENCIDVAGTIEQTILDSPYKDKYLEFCDYWYKKAKRYWLRDKMKFIRHFLLKYTYNENWSREMRENYFVNWDAALFNSVEESNYRIDYTQHFSILNQNKKIARDFGIDSSLLDGQQTHLKILLTREN